MTTDGKTVTLSYDEFLLWRRCCFRLISELHCNATTREVLLSASTVAEAEQQLQQYLNSHR